MKRLMPIASYTVLLLLCLGGLSAQAATIYVKIEGNDATPCAQAQKAQTPRRTLKGGIACLAGGDTLIVGGGEYDEAYDGAIPSGLSAQQPTTIMAAPGERVVMRPVTAKNSNNIAFNADGAYLVIDGINLNGAWTQGHGLSVGGHHNIYRNFEITQMYGQSVQGTVDNSQFINLHIHHNGQYDRPGNPYYPWRGYHHGIYLNGSNLLIENCSIHDHADGNGIQLYASNSNIRRNTIQNNFNNGIIALGGNNHIDNNLFIRNGTTHILMKGGGNRAFYNTLYGYYATSDPVGGIYTTSPTDMIKNNLVLNQYVSSAKAYILVEDSSNATQSGNALERGVDPAYVAGNLCDNSKMFGCAIVETDITRIVIDAAGENFHLTANSPAIGGGVPIPEVTVDKDGRPRTGAANVGAYQYTLQGPVLPAPQHLRATVQ